MPFQWIDKLNESNSRLHKEEVIGEAYTACTLGSREACIFLENAQEAYDPFTKFHTKQVPETEGLTNKKNSWHFFQFLLKDLSSRRITGNTAIQQVHELSKEFDSDNWNKLARPTLLKDLRVGATAKTFNKILKGTKYEIPTFECMLATDSKKHQKKLVGQKFIQKKLDGVRTLAILHPSHIELRSRNGKLFENFKSIERSLRKVRDVFYTALPYMYDPIVLDGEIMSEDFQSLMRQAQRKQNVQTEDCVYNVFDYIPYVDFQAGKWSQVQEDRCMFLDGVREKVKDLDNIDILETPMLVDLDTEEGHDDMTDYATECVNDGYEGIMIKDRFGVYECKRSTTWMKWKPVITVDLTVIAVEEGTGKNVGKLGAFVCEGTDQGKLIHVNVGSGLTDKNREEFWTERDNMIGQVVEIKADAVTQNQDVTSDVYSLRFPRFERFRGFDKGEKL
jgi:DNA ligase-1